LKKLRPAFLRWVLIASLIIFGTTMLFTTGIMSNAYKADLTKISFIIFGVFIIYSVKIGMLTYNASSKKNLPKTVHDDELGWFIADAFITAGMFGTVIGFIWMTEGTFGNVNPSNVGIVVSNATNKMALALYTTGSGLICSLALKIQLFNLSHYLNKIKQNAENIL